MEPLIGEIKIFAGDFAPRGWLLCNGQLLSINQYQTLFSIIQTYYGGDGMQTFALPDLRGRAAVSAGQAPNLSGYGLGQTKGSENVSITVNNLPAHSHGVGAVSGGTQNQPTPGGNLLCNTAIDPITGVGPALFTDAKDTDSTMNAKMIQATGGNQAMSVLQPVLALNYIIAWDGIYPSRP